MKAVKDLTYGFSGSMGSVVSQYIDYGIEGILQEDTDGIFDYVQSITGSIYSGSGLLEKNFTMLNAGDSMATLSIDLMEILQNGNYTWFI